MGSRSHMCAPVKGLSVCSLASSRQQAGPCVYVFLSPGACASGACMRCVCRCGGQILSQCKAVIYICCNCSPARGLRSTPGRGSGWLPAENETCPVPSTPPPSPRQGPWGDAHVSIWGGSVPRGGGQCGDTLCSQM